MNEMYESPEIFELGKAEEVTLGGEGNECDGCSKYKKCPCSGGTEIA